MVFESEMSDLVAERQKEMIVAIVSRPKERQRFINEIPKLFVNAEPGAILIGKLRDFCRRSRRRASIRSRRCATREHLAFFGLHRSLGSRPC